MSMLRHPPVELDDARGRRVAGLARAGALLGLVACVASSVALIGYGGDRHSALLMPQLPGPALAAVQPAAPRPTLPAPAATVQPQAQPVELREHDAVQEAYVAHGG